ncbi:uncharacterized protein B0H64DRAFT_105903 [Chaetomium fimeti]|uniref:Uncharacterized protein n=1 Tax=Chaetomium fimeti TaxID=1854472 RepID=A0AAE0HHE6_9PEZI|nr:hypothetical protein B0H64DRAFT_105903 [Chaetomium fimeti]
MSGEFEAASAEGLMRGMGSWAEAALGVWVETAPGITVGPVIIPIALISSRAMLNPETSTEGLPVYCPAGSPARAYCRLGYGWGNNWHWL